jgi:hypothetical protein
MNSLQNRVLNRIYGNGRGWVFSKTDFTDLGNEFALRKSLSRIEQKGIIRRIGRGLYDYPRTSKLLKSLVVPEFNSVAKAIAKKHGWTVHPSGATALNLLGLSTQVPAKITYLSDGPTRTVMVDGLTLHFKNTALKEIKLKPRTSLMVQAIKSIGRNHFNPKLISEFKTAFDEVERSKILKNANGISAWVYEIVREICSENQNG